MATLGAYGWQTIINGVTKDGLEISHNCVIVLGGDKTDTLLHELQHAADRIVYGSTMKGGPNSTIARYFLVSQVAVTTLMVTTMVFGVTQEIPWTFEAELGLAVIGMLFGIGVLIQKDKYEKDSWEVRAMKTAKRRGEVSEIGKN